MFPCSGDKITQLCEHANAQVFIASPFIKMDAMRRVIASIRTELSLIVVVRLLKDDLISGVTDIDAVDLLIKRPNTKVYFHPDLHAKIYRIDDKILIGSSNVTYKGLGWAQKSNIELLVDVSYTQDEIIILEQYLVNNSVLITDSIFNAIKNDYLSSEARPILFENYEERMWCPSCIRPEFLWDIQAKRDVKCTTEVYENARNDLTFLKIPEGLDKNEFSEWVSCIIKALPIYKSLFKKCKENTPNELGDQEVVIWLEEIIPNATHEDAWSCIKAWLKYFKTDLQIMPKEEVVMIGTRISSTYL